ncbi:MAG: hypothetical protein J6O50_08705 [Ruminiclostridium sp.]|nr:hypothetical protein [Ruminiclostridium sp.]
MTKEEKLIDAIGDTKDKNVLAAVGNENADPEMKTDVHHVEFREVPKLPEKDLKRMRIRNAILGGFAAAAVIAGGIVLWNSLQNNTIGTNPAQQSSTEPVVTIYQPGGSDDVSVTAEDRFEQITDTSMPLPFEYYDSRYNSIFQDLWVNKFTTISNKLLELSDNDKDLELMSKLSQIRCETPYTLDGNDGTMNLYWWMTELGLTIDKVYDAIENNNEYYRTRENFKDMIYTDEELAALRSEDRNKIAETFASEYCIVIGENVFSPKWLYYHTIEDYRAAGITPVMMFRVMNKYKEFELTDEAWRALCQKFYAFYFDLDKASPDVQNAIIFDVPDDLTFDDHAFEILEKYFYGEWEPSPENEQPYVTLPLTYSKSRNARFHGIIETDELYILLYTSSGGVGACCIIEKNVPDVLYSTELGFGFGNTVMTTGLDSMTKYSERKSEIPVLDVGGEISRLGMEFLVHNYGKDFEQLYDSTLNEYNVSFETIAFEDDRGDLYLANGYTSSDIRRYLIAMSDNAVTLGVPYVRDQQVLAQTPEYFAVAFTKDENGEWSVSYGEFDDVYADYPEFTIYSIKDTPYVAEFEMHDLELRGSSLLYQGGVVRLVDGADHSVLGEAPISTGLVGLNGYVCGKDTTIDYNVLADGGVLISIMLATEGKWVVPLYYYNGEKLVRVSESSSGGIADFQVSAKDWLGIEDDKIYITTSDDYVTGYTIDNGVLTKISREAPAYLSE